MKDQINRGIPFEEQTPFDTPVRREEPKSAIGIAHVQVKFEGEWMPWCQCHSVYEMGDAITEAALRRMAKDRGIDLVCGHVSIDAANAMVLFMHERRPTVECRSVLGACPGDDRDRGFEYDRHPKDDRASVMLLEATADIAYQAGACHYYSGDSRQDIADFRAWAEEFEKMREVDSDGNETYNGEDYMSAIEQFAQSKMKLNPQHLNGGSKDEIL